MTRYIVLPTLVVFALGLGAGWALRGGPQRSEEPLMAGPVAWYRTECPSHSLDEVLACHSRLDRCLEANLAAAKSAAAPTTRRKRTGASRAATYDTLCPHRLTLDVNGAVILVPCKTWDKDQDAGR